MYDENQLNAFCSCEKRHYPILVPLWSQVKRNQISFWCTFHNVSTLHLRHLRNDYKSTMSKKINPNVVGNFNPIHQSTRDKKINGTCLIYFVTETRQDINLFKVHHFLLQLPSIIICDSENLFLLVSIIVWKGVTKFIYWEHKKTLKTKSDHD